jgi:hypothetical protein
MAIGYPEAAVVKRIEVHVSFSKWCILREHDVQISFLGRPGHCGTRSTTTTPTSAKPATPKTKAFGHNAAAGNLDFSNVLEASIPQDFNQAARGDHPSARLHVLFDLGDEIRIMARGRCEENGRGIRREGGHQVDGNADHTQIVGKIGFAH